MRPPFDGEPLLNGERGFVFDKFVGSSERCKDLLSVSGFLIVKEKVSRVEITSGLQTLLVQDRQDSASCEVSLSFRSRCIRRLT